jgi:hypothetical protein
VQFRHFFIATLAFATLTFFPLRASAQLQDLITSINGDNGFESNAQTRYFNRLDCGFDQQEGSGGTTGAGGTGGIGGVGGMGGTGGVGGAGGMTAAAFASPKGSPEETTFEIRLDNTGGSVREVYLWVGGQESNCNIPENRNQTNARCAEIAGNPRSVGNNSLVSGLTLQNLLDARAGSTDIVTCESSGLTGTPYEIFVFRNTAPGGTEVDPSNYGVATFRVDVEAPAVVDVNTNPQRQNNFNITWSNPDPPDELQLYNFYWSFDDDPATAERLSITTDQTRTSQSIPASAINPPVGLDAGQTAYIFVTALDQAFVSDPQSQSNISAFSSPVEVTNVVVGGFCDATDDCSGCSASPLSLSGTGAGGTLVWLLGLTGIVAWRRRR